MPAWCLSVHASWTCRHSGACCRAGWIIPIEAPAFETLRRGFPDAGDRLVTGGPLPEGAAAILGAHADGTCRFHEGRLCAIHRRLGPGALPAACRQFPRQALRDDRGVFISLSHYCPTAASLLFDPPSIAVVPAPPSIALDGNLEGFEAGGALPPLLAPGLLTDLAGYTAWESHALEALASRGACAADAIEHVAAATRRLTQWRPEGGPLRDAVADALAGARPALRESSIEEDVRRYETARRAVPEGLAAPCAPEDPGLPRARAVVRAFDRVARAYLAARLFGNWIAYQACSLLTVVEYLRVACAVLTLETARQCGERPGAADERALLEAIRRTDLLLVHLADARGLTHAIEHDPHFRARTLSSLRHDRHALR